MLKQRLLVALVFLPVFIWAIFSVNPWPLWILIWAALILAALELATLIEHKGYAFSRALVLPGVAAMGVLAVLAPEGFRWAGVNVTLPLLFVAGFLAICLREVFRGDSERGFGNLALAAFALLTRWAGLDPPYLLGNLLLIVFAMVVSIVGHELAHALAGWLTGGRVYEIRLGGGPDLVK
ncbi:MAG: hypothetical protein HGA76_06240, partial [Candidatus Firestonebacteria bacterium]|nr:hypothetical protein [Candidatus Firestonebacteria bacterium]